MKIRWIGRVGQFLLILTGLASIAAFWAQESWFFELLCNFRMHYSLVFGSALLIALLFKRKRWLIVAGLLLGINSAAVFPSYPAVYPAPEGKPDYRLMSANVLQGNTWYGWVKETILKENPDIVLVIEIDYVWKEKLKSLESAYPYHEVYARKDGLGIGIFSRIPWEEVRVFQFLESSVWSVSARFNHQGKSWSLLGIHPPAPLVPAFAAERNQQLKFVAEWVGQQTQPVIVMGDFNLTSWSPHFKELIEVSQLRDSRAGFGRLPTWPHALRGLGITIDHCLVSDGVVVYDRRNGSHIGSDHRPIVIDVGINP